MDAELLNLVRLVRYNILTPDEALAKRWLSDAQRDELRKALADEE